VRWGAAVLAYGGERRIGRADEPLFDEVCALLAESSVILWNAKRYAQAGSFCNAGAFDLELADYLLHPEESRRTIDRAGFAHLGDTAELPADAGAEARAVHEALLAARLYAPMQTALAEAGLLPLYQEVERPLVPVLAAMEQTGICVNRAALERELAAANARIDALAEEIHALAGAEFNIGSPKQLGEILFERLGLAAGTKIKKTKTGYSTNAETLDELRGRHPIVDKVLTYRMWTKLRSTYLEGIGALIRPETGRVHTSFNQTVTATGRLSSSDPNLQNIPVRTEEGRAVRALFEPGEGYDALLSADYSQIELRILAHMSGDATLIDAFRHGQDVHARTAAEVSSEETVTTSSSRARHMRKVSSPMRRTATPSANRPTWCRVMGSPPSRAALRQADSSCSTPMTLIPGMSCLMRTATPAARPPPPTGTKTRSRWASCWMSSRPMVPWPAMTRGSSKGAL